MFIVDVLDAFHLGDRIGLYHVFYEGLCIVNPISEPGVTVGSPAISAFGFQKVGLEILPLSKIGMGFWI